MAAHGYWRSPKQHRLRGWMLHVHLWCGLAIGVWALAMGLSGSVLVFKDDIEGALHPEIFRQAAPPAVPGVAAAPLDAIAEEIQRRFPAHTLGGFRNLHEAERSGYVWIYRLDANGDLIQRYNVHFDQQSGRILGAIERYTGFPGWLENLHFFLLLGRPGLLVNGFFAIALLGMCATGLMLWWPGRGKLAEGFRVLWRSGWKRRNYDLHRVGGALSTGFLVLMAITGMYFGFHPAAHAMLGWLQDSQQAMAAFFQPPRVQLQEGHTRIRVDAVYRQSLRESGGLQVANITLPRKAGDAYTVDALNPGNPVTAGMVRSFLHPVDGRVLRRIDSARQPLGVRVSMAVAPIHFGQWGGWGAKALWAILGISPGALFLSGLLLWWNRALRRRVAAFSREMRPVALRRQRAN